MCLTVSPNIKDGGVFVNLLAYQESARSQQCIGQIYPIHDDGNRLVTVTNVCPFCFFFNPRKTMEREIIRIPQLRLAKKELHT